MANDLVEQACATPLTERLRAVPKDARLHYEHTPTCHSVFPVGFMAHEAADAIEALEARVAVLKGLLDEAESWLAISSTVNHDDLCAKIRAALSPAHQEGR